MLKGEVIYKVTTITLSGEQVSYMYEDALHDFIRLYEKDIKTIENYAMHWRKEDK